MTGKLAVVAAGPEQNDRQVVARIEQLGAGWAHMAGDVWLLNDRQRRSPSFWREVFEALGFHNVLVISVDEAWSARAGEPFDRWLASEWNGRRE